MEKVDELVPFPQMPFTKFTFSAKYPSRKLRGEFYDLLTR